MAKLVITKINFDVAAIAAALKVPVEDATRAFRDGRGCWPFSEIWGANLFEFIKHANTNEAFSDGAVVLKQLRDMKVSVKSLTNAGIKFQQSKYVGSGRSGSKDALIASIEECDRVVIVDVTEFPLVRFLPVDSTKLVGAAHKGELRKSGWSRTQLYAWIKRTYEVSEISLEI